MRIAELAERTGVPATRLRSYEEEGLLVAVRASHAPDEYEPSAIDHVVTVDNLFDAGLTTRLVRVVLDLDETRASRAVPDCSRATAESLHAQIASIDARIDCLRQSRETVRSYLRQSSHADLVDERSVPAA
ncbi:DNA-binding transcriptional regulator, MerR family [Plantibacter flavus]|uniref:DNA-binding transcriptional MerR regulator n=2 Tax=Plantibacter TaxID=190323 RepID=A0A3N2C0M0_9MICO|nr:MULTISPECIES: MerR family transcriptional regulator [Plantibacter]ROR81033.1 DNA-binding transcriptional MerR regulator [Plantibacter flavus]SMG07131.1 DNA-binding transcriptional regulator, MerR family [Plantibacter flavus]SMQ72368.1 DNA-binding transcriptional regulator, MerR family [Plantibacter sp. VKM Ac-1784]